MIKKLSLSLFLFIALLLSPSIVLAQQPGQLPANPTPTPAPPGIATPTPAPPTTGPQPSPLQRPPTPTPAPPVQTAPRTSTSGMGNALNFDVIQNVSGVQIPTSLGSIISSFIPYVFGIAGIILFFYLIWGGFSWMTSKGDPKATASAREKLTKAIVGFAIIFTAYWLTQILGMMFGVDQFGSVFK